MKSFIKFLRNSTASSFFLTLFFVISFGIGPHHPTANLTVLLAGIGVMLAWVNPTLIMSMRERFNANLKKIEVLAGKLEPGDEAAQKLVLEAMTELAMTGYAWQMRVLLNKTEASEASKSLTMGAATFAAGFALAAFCHWAISSSIAAHQAQLKLMQQILKDKHGLFSAAREAVAGAGAGAAEAASIHSPRPNPLLAPAVAPTSRAEAGLGAAVEAVSSPSSIGRSAPISLGLATGNG